MAALIAIGLKTPRLPTAMEEKITVSQH